MPSRPFYEPGNYVGEIIQQALGEAKTGTPQFILRIKVLGKPDPSDSSSYVPVQQYDRTIFRSITDKTIGYFLEDLKILGFTGDSFSQLDPGHSGHQSFIGQQVNVFCNHEAGQDGELRERWGLSTQRQMEISPLDAKKARQLDALFGKQLKTLSAAAPAAQPKAQPVAVGVGTYENLEVADDDLPF